MAQAPDFSEAWFLREFFWEQPCHYTMYSICLTVSTWAGNQIKEGGFFWLWHSNHEQPTTREMLAGWHVLVMLFWQLQAWRLVLCVLIYCNSAGISRLFPAQKAPWGGIADVSGKQCSAMFCMVNVSFSQCAPGSKHLGWEHWRLATHHGHRWVRTFATFRIISPDAVENSRRL